MHHGAMLVLAIACLPAVAQAQPVSRSMPLPAVDVTVADGAISVSQNGVRTPSGTATLVWQLKTEGFRFTSASIDFGDKAEFFSCSTLDFGKVVRCVKSAQAPSGQLGYRIRLSDGQSMLEMPQPNVFIQNE